MADKAANRLGTLVSSVGNGGLGDIVCAASAITADLKTFGALHDGQRYTVTITEGNNWEVSNNCLYTDATRTLSRGVLEDSSTGSRVSFSASAKVRVAFSSSQFNGLINAIVGINPLIYWQKALSDVLAGTRDIAIGFAGDSIKAGAFGGGVVSNTNNRQYAYANLLAKMFSDAGYNVNVGNVFGDQNFSGAQTTNLYNPEVVLNSGWSYSGSGATAWSLGGNWCSNNSNANRFKFTPRKVDGSPALFDRCQVLYISSAAYGNMSVGVDNGAAITTIDTSVPGGPISVKSATIVIPGAPASHSVDVFKTTAGDGKSIVLIGIITWNSTIKQIHFYNTAVGSSRIANFNATGNGYAIGNSLGLIPCDAWVIDQTVNNSNDAVVDSNYATDLTGLDAKLVAAGPCDILYASNYPIGTANGLANQTGVTAQMAAGAFARNRRFINPYSALGSFAKINAAGWFPSGETIHGNINALQDAVNRYYAALQP